MGIGDTDDGRELPGIPLRAYFGFGFEGYHEELDANFLLLSILTQARAASRTTALPGTGAAGDVLIVPSGAAANANEIAAWDGPAGSEAWVFFVPEPGWAFWVTDEAALVRWSGTAWEVQSPAGGGGATFAALSDTNISGPAQSHVPVWDSVGGTWINRHLNTTDLGDVAVTAGGYVLDDVLTWNGSAFTRVPFVSKAAGNAARKGADGGVFVPFVDAGGLEEAPEDGGLYGRRSGQWVLVSEAVPGGPVADGSAPLPATGSGPLVDPSPAQLKFLVTFGSTAGLTQVTSDDPGAILVSGDGPTPAETSSAEAHDGTVSGRIGPGQAWFSAQTADLIVTPANAWTVDGWFRLDQEALADGDQMNLAQIVGFEAVPENKRSIVRLTYFPTLERLVLEVHGTEMIRHDIDLPSRAWLHVAASWDLTTYRLAVNGTVVGETTDAPIALQITPVTASITTGNLVSSLDFSGYVDSLRVSAAALFTADFTPPGTAPDAPPAGEGEGTTGGGGGGGAVAVENDGTEIEAAATVINFGSGITAAAGGAAGEVTVTVSGGGGALSSRSAAAPLTLQASDLNTAIRVTAAGTVTVPSPATLSAADMDFVELYADVDGVTLSGVTPPAGFAAALAGARSYAALRNVGGTWFLVGLLASA